VKVFLSWSGEKSQRVALSLREWLPYVVHDLEPFVSAKDIDPGSRWQTEIAMELEATSYGIVCVTNENQAAPWLNFEAGALAKAVDKSRVIPLAIDLKSSDIKPPLSHFQAQPATRDGINEIVRSINAACERPSHGDRLQKAFVKWWPELEAELDVIAQEVPAPAGDTRTERELLEETLNIVRGLARASADTPSDVARDTGTSRQVLERSTGGHNFEPRRMAAAYSNYLKGRDALAKREARKAAAKKSGSKKTKTDEPAGQK
jgi:TIR domain